MNANQKKNIIYSIVLLASVAVVWWFRNQPADTNNKTDSVYITVQGQTMGTTYNIKYRDEQQRNFKSGIDSLLEVFNQSVNHYLPN